MKIINILLILSLASCSNQKTNGQNEQQVKEKEPEMLQFLNDSTSTLDINPDNSFKLISEFLDSCKNLPASKKNLNDFMFPINEDNLSHKHHQYILDYKIDSFKYPFVFVVVKPKLNKYEIDSDWTKLLTFKMKVNGSKLSIEPSVKNRVYRSFWETKNIKELIDNKIDYSDKWFYANIDSSIYFEEITNEINSKDLSEIFTPQRDCVRNGVFGKNYYRIQICISSVKKGNNEYIVQGKSKLKDNVAEFNGIIKPRLALKYDNEGLDMSPIIILSDYEFKEKNGVFKGVLASYCYKDSNEYKLDTRASIADEYFNNGFVGIWKSSEKNEIYKCIWANGRLPYTNDFDIGTGEFCPNDKYLQYGWENYKKALNMDKEAIKIEEKYRLK